MHLVLLATMVLLTVASTGSTAATTCAQRSAQPPLRDLVDEMDIVWLSDFGGDSVVRFDPTTEAFTVLALPHTDGGVRQILGRPGEVWGAESAADHLIVIRTTR